jgi:hypothetical protein
VFRQDRTLHPVGKNMHQVVRKTGLLGPAAPPRSAYVLCMCVSDAHILVLSTLPLIHSEAPCGWSLAAYLHAIACNLPNERRRVIAALEKG